MTKAISVGLVLGAVLLACGGGVAPIDADGGAGSSGGSGGGSSGGTGVSSSSSSSSGGTSGGTSGTSGGMPGGPPTGGSSGAPPPPPATVTCGSASCDTSTQDCCDSRASGTLMCVAKGACMGASLTCTSAADCPMGQVCCLGGGGPGPGGGGAPQSSCDMRCGRDGPGGGGQQLCASDAECGMRHCFKDSAGLGICAPF